MARKPKDVASLAHDIPKRLNVPTAEQQAIAQKMDRPETRTYDRADPLVTAEDRDPDLDPQIVWEGAEITLTEAQLDELRETGRIALGRSQLTWRRKDTSSAIEVAAPPLYVQEHVRPQAIIDGLRFDTETRKQERAEAPDLFGDEWAESLDPEAKTEFYEHGVDWSNRMILGDSLQAMASLAQRERLAGQVQCIYFDPPYGIKFNSNWQVSTRSRDVKDGKREEITREPEQVRAFRDTWKDGIHSYLTYLRDRLTAMRELLTESGSIFVQIGDENVHRVRAVMDEVFGEENFVAEITLKKAAGAGSPSGATDSLARIADYVLWFASDTTKLKYRQPFYPKVLSEGAFAKVYRRVLLPDGTERTLAGPEVFQEHTFGADKRVFRIDTITNASPGGKFVLNYQGQAFRSSRGYWLTTETGMDRIAKANRLNISSKGGVGYVRFFRDFPASPFNNVWTDISQGGFNSEKTYVVQTNEKIVQRCILMTTDPGDLVLDPTCGSGTTATVAEQWGRRWITMDTSRVALALARARIMGARYPSYLLRDSHEGARKEAELIGAVDPDDGVPRAFAGRVRDGFVYERAPHITLKSIANNPEIDTIWERAQEDLEPVRLRLNEQIGRTGQRASPSDAGEVGPWEEWEIPRQPGDPWPDDAAKEHAKAVDASKSKTVRSGALGKLNKALGRDYDLDTLPEHPVDLWSDEEAIRLHAAWWEVRIERQRKIDASVARRADVELLYDRPYSDPNKVRVAGPFTVESLSPHRMVSPDEFDEDTAGIGQALHELDPEAHTAPKARTKAPRSVPERDFAQMVIDNLQQAGVQQATKDERIRFDSIQPWAGEMVAATGDYTVGGDGEGDAAEARRAAIFIGPEFGTITRPDLIRAAKEAAEIDCDTLVACGFAYDAHTTELTKLGAVPILKARMNPDLHMAEDLKATGSGNLFVVFGEPDVKWHEDEEGKVVVEVLGVDVFDPRKGEVRASGKGEIAAWFIDTDYDDEAFHVRHAYFLGANDPYKSLKTTLKDEIDAEAWSSLERDVSRPFAKPQTGRFAVKVINHLGDEVMRVFDVAM